MGQNAAFDPGTRDYTPAQGSITTSDDVKTAAYFVLKIPRGRWLYGTPNQGSELFKFQNAKRTSNVEQLFQARVMEPIQNQLIKTGRASAVSVKNLEATRTGTSNEINIVESPVQPSAQLKFSPVG